MIRCVYAIMASLALLLSGCEEKKPDNVMRFAMSADYPPFEYYKNGKLSGFDVDLANLVAKELGKTAVFEDMSLGAAMTALQNESVDAVISSISPTEERRKNLDFSRCYYIENLAAVYEKNEPYTTAEMRSDAKLACQMGTSLEAWVKEHVPNAQLILMDNNNEIIESLKAGHVDCVIINDVQAKFFCENNPQLAYSTLSKSEEGYAIAFKKQSHLREKVNIALRTLEENGEIERLREKWIAGATSGKDNT